MISITFDIDWAPDWCIELCSSVCTSAGIEATFFATHQSDILKDLKSNPRFELGIHPNLLPRSNHGSTWDEILGFVLNLVPDAKCMRTHALVQSSPFLEHVINTTGIETDVSLFLPFYRGLMASKLYLQKDGREIIRLPYFWEDDISLTGLGGPGQQDRFNATA